MRPNSPAALAAIALVAIAVLAGGCGDDDGAGNSATTTGVAGPAGRVGSTATQPGSQERGGNEAGGGSGDSAAGGDEGSSGGSGAAGATSDEGARTVPAAIRAVLTDAGSPEQACGTFVTEQFLRRAYGGRANCLAARRPNALGDSVEITRSFVSGPGAHAVAIPSGGPYHGAKVEIEVVAANGSSGPPYKLDSLKAHIPAGP